jgi:Transposase domain (DUF772)
MSMHPHAIGSIPEETVRVARAAFPRGNIYLTMRDQLGTLYEDQNFAALFPKRGRPAEAPWQLALVCVFQFIEGLSDRQAAEAVRSGITDSELSAPIHETLAKRDLLPREHFLDSGYVDADLLVKSQHDLGIEVIGPMRPDSSWQAQAEQGYDVAHFTVDWESHQVVCPHLCALLLG